MTTDVASVKGCRFIKEIETTDGMQVAFVGYGPPPPLPSLNFLRKATLVSLKRKTQKLSGNRLLITSEEVLGRNTDTVFVTIHGKAYFCPKSLRSRR